MSSLEGHISRQLRDLHLFVHGKLEQVDRRFERLETRFERLETRCEQMETRLGRLDAKVDAMPRAIFEALREERGRQRPVSRPAPSGRG